MDERVAMLKDSLLTEIDRMWQELSWGIPREEADRQRFEAIQACHRLHRAANPAYRDRCEREGIGERLEPDQFATLCFPEEIYKGYAEKVRANGEKLGIFCERDVPLLLEHLNYYLVEPITMDGLAGSYIRGTNIKGGLDLLREDLRKSQDIILFTSSGTSGTMLSLIPLDRESYDMIVRAHRVMFDIISTTDGYGPISPDEHFLVAHTIDEGSMLMSVTLKAYASQFGDRGIMTLPARVQTRELRWRGGKYYGPGGKLLGLVLKPLLALGGKGTARKGVENLVAGLKRAEELGLRTEIFGNPWLLLNALRQIEAMLEAEIAAGNKQPGDHFVDLAPGSVVVFGGGNKSGSDVTEEDIAALMRRLIGGIDKVSDGYGQSESYCVAVRCAEGNYHFGPHIEVFMIDQYLAYYDPRQTNRIPSIVTGDIIDGLHEEPCACGDTSRYFRYIHRDDENRGSKGCAAALAEYA
jgi:hypothetical protein